jgi:hypothetical protein
MAKARSNETQRRKAPQESSAFYIATDLVVSSRRSLAPLAAALPDAYHPIASSGRPMARLLVLNGISGGSVEADFQQLMKRLSGLRGDARRSWRAAGRRVFDIGVQAGNETHPFDGVRLSAATLGAAAALGVQVQLTIYRPGAYDASETKQ